MGLIQRVAHRYLWTDLEREFQQALGPESLLRANAGHAGAIQDLLTHVTNILNYLDESEATAADDRLERRVTLTREHLKHQHSQYPVIYDKGFGGVLLGVLDQLRRLYETAKAVATVDTEETKVGNFRIRNVGWHPGNVDMFEATIKKAIRAIAAKGYGRIATGDLQFVRIDQMPDRAGPHALAAYRTARDDVLISMLIFDGDPVKTLVHELAHRLYYKEMSQEQRSLWQGIYKDTRKFPTQYARHSAKEYFAECFAYWCLGKLPRVHLENLKKVGIG